MSVALVTLHKNLEDVKKDIIEAERCVILKINHLHPHSSLAVSTIDVCMPVSRSQYNRFVRSLALL